MLSRAFLLLFIILFTKKFVASKVIDLHVDLNDDNKVNSANLIVPYSYYVNSLGFYDISTQNKYHSETYPFEVCIFILFFMRS